MMASQASRVLICSLCWILASGAILVCLGAYKDPSLTLSLLTADLVCL